MTTSSNGKTKGLLWTDPEIEVMLRALYQINAGLKVMNSTNVETTTIFERVAEIMKEKGYLRNYGQIRAKFKKEKSHFYESMEDHGGMPPEELWGPRFHLLKDLWEQGEKPDYRRRRPATSGKGKKRNLDQETQQGKGEASSTTLESNGPSQNSITPAKDLATGVSEEQEGPSFIVEERKPTYEELVKEVLTQRLDISRLKNTCEFLRQGFYRLKTEHERYRMAEAIRQQEEESDSDVAEEDEDNSVEEEEESQEEVEDV